MPFIAHWPQKITPRKVDNSTLCLTDFMATAAAIVGDSLAKDAGPDSFNFLPLILTDEATINRPPVIHHSLDGMFAISDGAWKLIDGLGSGGFTDPQRIAPNDSLPDGQLYHLANDANESENRYNEKTEIVAKLQKQLKEIIKE